MLSVYEQFPVFGNLGVRLYQLDSGDLFWIGVGQYLRSLVPAQQLNGFLHQSFWHASWQLQELDDRYFGVAGMQLPKLLEQHQSH